MIRNSFAIVAAAALAGAAMPAMAQDGAYEYGTYPPPPAVSEVYGAGDYRQGTYPEQGEVQYHGSYPGGPMVHPGAPGAYPMQSPGVPEAYPTAPGLPPMPNLGYTHDDRKAWLADCRTPYYGEGKKKGGIIGGVLGAVTGGIIGHEVTNGSSTRRLGGTLIGAGVGGLAGLAIGAMIGAASDDKKIDECEAYLRRYEGSYGGGDDRDYPAPPHPHSH